MYVSCHEVDWAVYCSVRTAMWSMSVVLTETENENDSVNQNYVAKTTLQK